MGNYSTKLSILIIIFLSISLASCRKEGGEVVGQSKQDFTPEEIAMVGEQISQAIEDNPVTFDIIDRTQMEPGYQYVEQLFHTLVNTAPVLNRLNFDWKIQILENDSLRTAFIGPGGHFYIYTGMLKYLESETELLSVIGHEIYYADRGGVEKAIISEFGGDSFGDLILGQPVSSINDIALYLNDVSYPEETIFSADSFSVELICPFLYDPLGLHHII